MSDSPSFDQLEVQNLASHSSPHQGHSGQNQGQAGPHQVHGFKLVGFSQNHLMNDSAPPLCTDDEVFFWSKLPAATPKHEIDTALTETTSPPTPMKKTSSSSSILSLGRKSPPPIAESLIISIKNKNASKRQEHVLQKQKSEKNFKTENVETEQQHQFNVIQTGLSKYTKQFDSQTKVCVDGADQHLGPLSTLVKELAASTAIVNDERLGSDLISSRKSSIFYSKSTENIPAAEFYYKTLNERKGSIAQIFQDEAIKIEKEQGRNFANFGHLPLAADLEVDSLSKIRKEILSSFEVTLEKPVGDDSNKIVKSERSKSTKMDDSEIFLLDSEQSPDEDRSESPLEKLTSYLLNQNWFSKESDKSESSRSSDRLSEEDFVSDQARSCPQDSNLQQFMTRPKTFPQKLGDLNVWENNLR